jgi:glycosyltransferase involved in cell wall biosynthesis
MKVLMLGWEYPPHICGGLGIACEGLSIALARNGVGIDFVIPHASGDEDAGHMRFFDSVYGVQNGRDRKRKKKSQAGLIQKQIVPSLLSPYLNPRSFDELLKYYRSVAAGLNVDELPPHIRHLFLDSGEEAAPASHYGSNIFEEVNKFAAHVLVLMGKADFDIIHAHDWMTFPAAVSLSRLTGKPLVVHIHSLEYDRSGHHPNNEIHEIESLGVHAANAVIAVSFYTASIMQQQHNLPSEKIHVVHNGVYDKKVVQTYRRKQSATSSKIVLFLGRITFQKGPDYFVEAAARVIPHIPDVKFVMAGAGDMLNRMIDRVHQLDISRHFEFPGFLRGEELEEMFSIADLYIMPSVSEPFGISALEAINYDTPVIISKQSGVSEVLGHALKVDFWDIERMADLIINGLLHEELRSDMLSMAREEVKKLKWDASALKTLEVYRQLY